MAYNVMSEIKKGVYVPLDISKSNLFERTSRYKETRYSLEEIDRFTINFETINGLIKHMIEFEILDENTFNKPLSIRLPQKGDKPRKVMYDFLYHRDKKYIDDPGLLIKDIGRMQSHSEFNFCWGYANHFIRTYDSRDIAPELSYFFDKSLRENIADNRLYARDGNGDIPIIRMTKQLIYSYLRNYGENIYDYSSIKYRNLHDIIAFCENYHNKKVVREEENLTPNKGKVKTLKKDLNQVSFEE